MRRSAEHGEKWVNAHDPKELAERLRSMGFADLEVLGPADASERYLSGRHDGLTVAGYFSMIKATVS